MDKVEISIHEARIYLAVKSNKSKWLTNIEIGKLVPDISGSTIRHTTYCLFKKSLIERQEVFPSFRYRWSDRREQRDHSYELRLESACEAFGLNPQANQPPSVGTLYCVKCGKPEHAGKLCE